MMSHHLSSHQCLFSDLLGSLGQVVGGNPEIRGLTMDSRAVRPGYLFLACKGLSAHGLEFAAEAIERGAVAIAWEPAGFDVAGLPVPMARVAGLTARAGEIAARFYGYPSEQMMVVGITGTNGKTSVAHYLAQCLDQPGERAGLIGTLGVGLYGEAVHSGHTTPDVVTNQRLLAGFLQSGATSTMMEVSSHALVQGRVNAIRFATTVFTNLSHDHLDYHGDMASYAEAKRKLFFTPGLESAVINIDDEVGRRLLEDLPADTRKVACSLRAPLPGTMSVWAESIRSLPEGMAFSLHTPWGRASLQSQLVGEFNVANLLSTAAVLLLSGMPFERVVALLQRVRPVAGRMETFGGGEQPLVVVDYAHTPDALEHSLQALRSHTEGKLICVFGCGGDRDVAKRPEMGRIVEQLADIALITNDNPRTESAEKIVSEIQQGLSLPDAMPVVFDRRDAIEEAIRLAGKGDAVLIAGKGHEDYQIIGRQRFPFSDREVVVQYLGGVL